MVPCSCPCKAWWINTAYSMCSKAIMGDRKPGNLKIWVCLTCDYNIYFYEHAKNPHSQYLYHKKMLVTRRIHTEIFLGSKCWGNWTFLPWKDEKLTVTTYTSTFLRKNCVVDAKYRTRKSKWEIGHRFERPFNLAAEDYSRPAESRPRKRLCGTIALYHQISNLEDFLGPFVQLRYIRDSK